MLLVSAVTEFPPLLAAGVYLARNHEPGDLRSDLPAGPHDPLRGDRAGPHLAGFDAL